MTMWRNDVLTAAMWLLALGMSAAGGEGSDDLTFRFRDETAPAGGTVQMKLEDTDGTPISGGRPRFAFAPAFFDAVAGIGMFAPTGELAGAAVIDGNQVAVCVRHDGAVHGRLPDPDRGSADPARRSNRQPDTIHARSVVGLECGRQRRSGRECPRAG